MDSRLRAEKKCRKKVGMLGSSPAVPGHDAAGKMEPQIDLAADVGARGVPRRQ